MAMLQVVFHARSSDAFASGRCAHALRPALTSGSPGEKQCSSHSFQTADNFFLHSTRWLRGASYQSSVADDVAQPAVVDDCVSADTAQDSGRVL